MKPITLILRERQLRHLGHVLRLSDSEPAKTLALYDPVHGHRFTEYVSGLISDEPKEWTRDTITSLAQNREQWRERVAGAGTY